MALAKLQEFEYGNPPGEAKVLFATIDSSGEVAVEVPPTFDLEKTRTVFQKKLDELIGHLKRHIDRIENADFRAKADPETVEQVTEKIAELTRQTKELEQQMSQLAQSA
jgi:valyl-tRNA synthetase